MPDWTTLYIAAGRKSLSELRSRRSLAPNSQMARLELVARLARENDSTYEAELVEELQWLAEHVDWYVWGRIGGVLAITQPGSYRRIAPLLQQKALLPDASEIVVLNAFLFCERSEPDFSSRAVDVALRRFPDGKNVAYWWDKQTDIFTASSLRVPDYRFGAMLSASDNAITSQTSLTERSSYIIKRIGRSLDVDIVVAQASLGLLLTTIQEVPDPLAQRYLRYEAEIATGRTYVRYRDISSAGVCLLRSLSHDPQNCPQAYVGPDLELAREIYVSAGPVVREYVEKCAYAFVRHKARLLQITSQIDEGKIEPTFSLSPTSPSR